MLLIMFFFSFFFSKQMKFVNNFQNTRLFIFLFLKIIEKQECNEPKLGITMQLQLPCLFFFSKNQNFDATNATKVSWFNLNMYKCKK